MTQKTQRIVSFILLLIPSFMLAMSGIMKVIGAEAVVQGLGAVGLGKYITLFGVVELVSVGLLLYPRTYKVGFLLLTGYLGGALSIELMGGQMPTAALLLVVLWVGVFLRDRHLFLTAKK